MSPHACPKAGLDAFRTAWRTAPAGRAIPRPERRGMDDCSCQTYMIPVVQISCGIWLSAIKAPACARWRKQRLRMIRHLIIPRSGSEARKCFRERPGGPAAGRRPPGVGAAKRKKKRRGSVAFRHRTAEPRRIRPFRPASFSRPRRSRQARRRSARRRQSGRAWLHSRSPRRQGRKRRRTAGTEPARGQAFAWDFFSCCGRYSPQ